MSVLLIEANKNGKYEFTKDELQKLLDQVEQEAFERGMSFGRKEKEYVYLNSFSTTPINVPNPYIGVNWNEVTCGQSTYTDPRTIQTVPTDATRKSTCTNVDLGTYCT